MVVCLQPVAEVIGLLVSRLSPIKMWICCVYDEQQSSSDFIVS